MIDTVLEQELNERRLMPTGFFATDIPLHKGMCELFEDRPTSPSLGFFTVAFAEHFCRKNPGYTWKSI